MHELALLGPEHLDAPGEIGLARLELVTEALLTLCDADSLRLELRGDPLLPVVVLGLDVRELGRASCRERVLTDV